MVHESESQELFSVALCPNCIHRLCILVIFYYLDLHFVKFAFCNIYIFVPFSIWHICILSHLNFVAIVFCCICILSQLCFVPFAICRICILCQLYSVLFAFCRAGILALHFVVVSKNTHLWHPGSPSAPPPSPEFVIS